MAFCKCAWTVAVLPIKSKLQPNSPLLPAWLEAGFGPICLLSFRNGINAPLFFFVLPLFYNAFPSFLLLPVSQTGPHLFLPTAKNNTKGNIQKIF